MELVIAGAIGALPGLTSTWFLWRKLQSDEELHVADLDAQEALNDAKATNFIVASAKGVVSLIRSENESQALRIDVLERQVEVLEGRLRAAEARVGAAEQAEADCKARLAVLERRL